jgi:hypothetical protein
MEILISIGILKKQLNFWHSKLLNLSQHAFYQLQAYTSVLITLSTKKGTLYLTYICIINLVRLKIWKKQP